MKNLFYWCVCGMLFIGTNNYAQLNCEWALQGGSPGFAEGYDYANDVVVDNDGNSYVTGYFEMTATFGNTTVTSSGWNDVFISKYNSMGDEIWTKKAGGIYDDEAYAIALDNYGNVYISGYFEGSSTFGTTTLSAGNRGAFIAKYDATTGDEVWAIEAVQGNYLLDAPGIGTDTDGNVFISGYFESTAQVGSTIFTSQGFKDVFIAKFDSSGTGLWARQGSGASYDRATDLAVDADNNVYVTGTFGNIGDDITFSGNTLSSPGRRAIFIVKYDTNGNLVWLNQAGGPEYSYGKAIAVDGDQNCYITGYFEGDTYFDTDTLTVTGAYDSYDIYIAKYDMNGDFSWVNQMGSDGTDRGYSVAVDNTNNVYVAGNFRNTLIFDSSTSLISSGGTDIFIAKYTPSGNLTWAHRAGAADSELCYSVAIDDDYNVIATGYFFYEMVFGSTVINSVGGPNTDMFLAKLKDIYLSNDDELTINKGVNIYPNPNNGLFNLEIENVGDLQIEITNINGRIVFQKYVKLNNGINHINQQIDLSNIGKGIYVLKYQHGENINTEKLIIY